MNPTRPQYNMYGPFSLVYAYLIYGKLPIYYLNIMIIFWKILFNLFFIASRSRCISHTEGQRETSVKTFRTPLSAEFRKHCVLSGGTQRRVLPRYQCKKMKILNITFQRVGIEATTYCVYSRMLVYLRHDWRINQYLLGTITDGYIKKQMLKTVLVKMARSPSPPMAWNHVPPSEECFFFYIFKCIF